MSKSDNVVQEVESVGSLYDFEEVLGEGTFASVWRAVERGGAGRRVAIKQVQVHPLEKDMAYREVQNLEKVESDHIIKYYTSIYDNNESTLNLVMELCAGSLRTHLPHRTYSKAELLSFTAQMDAAFLELLQKKLMHLDLKPENILIATRSNNCFKICDFGCAQIAIQSKLTKYDNQTFGTFNYLAPENYLNYHGKLTNTSADIWSLGVILYEMMYKRLPLPVDGEGFIDRKAMQRYFQGNEDGIKYPMGPPQEVVKLVKKMLRAKPKDRITWVQLRQELLGLGFDEYHFANTKRIYFKHVKTLRIFLTFIVILRKDIELNPHPFWKNNQAILQEMADTLVHLSYLLCLKFDTIYSYKFREFLEPQWIEDLSFMRRHIEFEEVALARSKDHRMSALEDLAYTEEVLLNCVREVRKQLGQHPQFWVTMEELDIFCQETIRRGELKKSFFAAADNDSYGETMKALDIN